MTFTEFMSIVIGLFIGYWLVTSLIEWKTGKQKSANETYKNSSSSQNSRQQSSQSSGQSKGSERQQQPPPNENDLIENAWFRILEVSKLATKEQISTAYKRKIRQYHPDKVAALGPELKELAEFKSKQINAAYDYGLKLRG